MIEELIARTSIIGGIVLLGLTGIYRLLWAMGPHIRKWIDDLVQHWISSEKAQDGRWERLVQGQIDLERRLAQHGMDDMSRHQGLVEKIESVAKENRHASNNAWQAVTASHSAHLEQTKDYLCERVEEVQQQLRDIHGDMKERLTPIPEDSEDIKP